MSNWMGSHLRPWNQRIHPGPSEEQREDKSVTGVRRFWTKRSGDKRLPQLAPPVIHPAPASTRLH